MSKIWKGIHKFFIKLLNFSYNNVWFKLIILFTGILCLLLSLFFSKDNLYKIVNLAYIIFMSMYIFGWSYDTDKKDERIKELEGQLNADIFLVFKEDVKEDLAYLMHEIWARDIISNTYNSDKKEIERAGQVYYSLSDSDKKINREKADKVIKLLEKYIS